MTVFLFSINVLLLGRLIAFEAEKQTRIWRLVVMAVLQAIALSVTIDDKTWGIIPLLAVAVNFLVLSITERFVTTRTVGRLATLFALLLLVNGTYGMAAPSLREWVMPQYHWIVNRSLLGPSLNRINFESVQKYVLAALFCSSEANLLLVAVIKALGVNPPRPQDVAVGLGENAQSQSLMEFRRGGLIGIIERYLILIFVFHDAFNAIAFILTAKSIVRFHDDDKDKQVAEYTLVGTLLSTLIAVLVGLIIH